MTDEPPFLVPRRIRNRLSRARARLCREIAAGVADRTPCAVGYPGDVADAAKAGLGSRPSSQLCSLREGGSHAPARP